MMANISNVITQSRFACLDIEDDDSGSKQDTKKKNSKSTNRKASAIKKSAQPQPSKQQTTVPKKKKPKQEASEQQWEEWKEKDSQLVNGNFEQDMKDAILESILQSQFDSKKISKSDGELVDNDKNKKKKKKCVTLRQFLDESPIANEQVNAQPFDICDKKFFEDIISGAKQELNKEEARERRKKNNENVDQLIYEDQLEKEKAKRFDLELEVRSLREEMKAVKARNKTLCSLLSQGEMKDKVQILKELERLTTMKDELTQEVARLHTELEQERSKSASLTSDSKNQAKKKSKKH